MNFRFAAEMVRNGRIGRIHTVNVNVGGAPLFSYNLCGEPQSIFNWDRWLGPSAVQPYNSNIAPLSPSAGGWAGWRNYSDFGGGGQCDWGAHMYDIAQWGLGRDGDAPVCVIPAEQGNPEKQNLTYLYADGVKMVRSQNTHFKKLYGGLEFIGDKGVIYVERGQLISDPIHLMSEPTSGTEATVYRSIDHTSDFINGMKTRQRTICNEQVGASTAIVCHLGNIADYIGEPFKFDYKTGLTDNAAANRCLNPPKRAHYTI
jgi:predicted dehydrogenase